MKTRAVEDQDTLKGEISIISTPGLCRTWLMHLIMDFKKKHPDVSFKIITDDFGDGNLMFGEADLSISSSPPQNTKDTESRLLGTYPLHMYVSREYAAERGMPGSFTDLDRHDIVTWSSRALVYGSPEIMDILIHRDKKIPQRTITCEVSSDNALLAAVAAGAGVTLMPAFMGESEHNLIRVPFFDQTDHKARHKKHITWSKTITQSRRHQAFLEAIREKAEKDPEFTDVWT